MQGFGQMNRTVPFPTDVIIGVEVTPEESDHEKRQTPGFPRLPVKGALVYSETGFHVPLEL